MGHMLDRKALLSALVTIVAVTLAACGGGDATPTRAPATPVSSAPAATATATVLAPSATPASTSPAATATSPAATATAVAPPTATSAPTATRPAVATGTPVAQPKYGGILTRRFLQDPSTPDLYDLRGATDVNGFMAIYNNLILINPYNEAELIADLAESWTVGENGLKLTFKLRKGVQWHDGKPFTAADAVYTYNRAINPPSAAIRRNAGVFSTASKAEALDEFTVVVTLRKVSNSFLRGIGSSPVNILPAHLQDMTAFANKPIGTGPFKFDKRQVNVDLVLTKNERYWRKDARGSPLPYLDSMHIVTITDNGSAYAAFRTGRLDFMSPFEARALTPSLVSGALKRDLPDVIVGEAFGTRSDLLLNKANPALADPRVRKAIHLAIDRQTLARVLSATQLPATPLAGPLIPPEMGGLWGIPQSELQNLPGFRGDKTADLAEAKRLLQQAGIDPKTITLRVLATSTFPEGEVIADNMRGTLGFTVKVELYPTQGAAAEALLRGDFDMYRNTGLPTFDDPSTYLETVVRTNGAGNFGKWSDPELDKLLDQQESELDIAKRKQLLLDVQRRVIEDASLITIYANTAPFAWYPYVKNQPGWSASFGNQWRFEEVWISK